MKPEDLNERANSDRLFFSNFKVSYFVPVLVCGLVLFNFFMDVDLSFIMLPLVCGWLAYLVHRYLCAVQWHLSGVVEIPILIVGALIFIALVLAAAYLCYAEFPGVAV